MTEVALGLLVEIARGVASAPQSQPRVALSVEEAAAALGVSRDFFDEHVKPELRVVRRGRLVLVPVREVEAWVERAAALTLGDA